MREKGNREREELLNKVKKIALSVERDKTKKTPSELCDELEKELEDENSLEEVIKPSRKRKVTMKKVFQSLIFSISVGLIPEASIFNRSSAFDVRQLVFRWPPYDSLLRFQRTAPIVRSSAHS
uniref:Uncharacterized protein n=1 Tax=Cucumis sativus TaxID=3659 RepID=A0A0A0KN01_CUCSA